jgi:hypothetical protein
MGRVQGRVPAYAGLALAVCLAAFATAGPVSAQMEMGAAVAQTPTSGGVAADLLKFAPEGTWVAAAMDGQRLVSAPMLAPLQMANPAFAQKAQGLKGAVVFVLPMAPPMDNYDGPLWGGLVRLGPGMRPMIEAEIAQAKMAESVAGLVTYDMDKFLLAFIDDTTLAAGVDAEVLTTIVGSYQSGAGAGVTDDLAEIMSPHAGRAIHAGAAFPVPMRQMVSNFDGEGGPPFMGGLSGAALGLDVAPGLALRAHMRFTNAAEAQQMLAEAKAGVAKMRESFTAMQAQAAQSPMAASMAPIMVLFDKLQLTADGPDFRAALDLNQQEMQALQGAAMMATMAFSGQMGGPPAGGMMPGGPMPGQ